MPVPVGVSVVTLGADEPSAASPQRRPRSGTAPLRASPSRLNTAAVYSTTGHVKALTPYQGFESAEEATVRPRVAFQTPPPSVRGTESSMPPSYLRTSTVALIKHMRRTKSATVGGRVAFTPPVGGRDRKPLYGDHSVHNRLTAMRNRPATASEEPPRRVGGGISRKRLVETHLLPTVGPHYRVQELGYDYKATPLEEVLARSPSLSASSPQRRGPEAIPPPRMAEVPAPTVPPPAEEFTQEALEEQFGEDVSEAEAEAEPEREDWSTPPASPQQQRPQQRPASAAPAASAVPARLARTASAPPVRSPSAARPTPRPRTPGTPGTPRTPGSGRRPGTAPVRTRVGTPKLAQPRNIDFSKVIPAANNHVIDGWCEDFETGGRGDFASVMVEVEVKLKAAEAADAASGEDGPSALRTAVACAALDDLCEMFGRYSGAIRAVRDALIPAIYCSDPEPVDPATTERPAREYFQRRAFFQEFQRLEEEAECMRGADARKNTALGLLSEVEEHERVRCMQLLLERASLEARVGHASWALDALDLSQQSHVVQGVMERMEDEARHALVVTAFQWKQQQWSKMTLMMKLLGALTAEENMGVLLTSLAGRTPEERWGMLQQLWESQTPEDQLKGHLSLHKLLSLTRRFEVLNQSVDQLNAFDKDEYRDQFIGRLSRLDRTALLKRIITFEDWCDLLEMLSQSSQQQRTSLMLRLVEAYPREEREDLFKEFSLNMGDEERTHIMEAMTFDLGPTDRLLCCRGMVGDPHERLQLAELLTDGFTTHQRSRLMQTVVAGAALDERASIFAEISAPYKGLNPAKLHDIVRGSSELDHVRAVLQANDTRIESAFSTHAAMEGGILTVHVSDFFAFVHSLKVTVHKITDEDAQAVFEKATVALDTLGKEIVRSHVGLTKAEFTESLVRMAFLQVPVRRRPSLASRRASRVGAGLLPGVAEGMSAEEAAAALAARLGMPAPRAGRRGSKSNSPSRRGSGSSPAAAAEAPPAMLPMNVMPVRRESLTVSLPVRLSHFLENALPKAPKFAVDVDEVLVRAHMKQAEVRMAFDVREKALREVFKQYNAVRELAATLGSTTGDGSGARNALGEASAAMFKISFSSFERMLEEKQLLKPPFTGFTRKLLLRAFYSFIPHKARKASEDSRMNLLMHYNEFTDVLCALAVRLDRGDLSLPNRLELMLRQLIGEQDRRQAVVAGDRRQRSAYARRQSIQFSDQLVKARRPSII